VSPSRLIQALRTPRSGAGTTGGRRGTTLPPDLLREAGRRLGILARLIIALAVINLTLGHTLFPALLVAWPWVSDVVVSSVALLSLGVFLYTRRPNTDPASFVTLGLVYEVVVAAAVASVEHASLSATAMTAGPTVSRLVPVILIFSAIVPSTPSRTLLTGLIAASMDPLAMATVIAARHFSVPPAHLLWMHIPDYMAAGVGTLIAQVITRLGREVRDARELGSYRLGELLGRGGMGEVYVAHHRMLARPAAIKLIRPEKLEFDGGDQAERTVQRFTREAQAAASLRSPHTIELYDFGETDDGTLYFVMELLDGIEGPRLRHRQVAAPHGRGARRRDRRRQDHGDAGIHAARDGRGGCGGRARGPLRCGMCGILASDGAAGVRWRDGLPGGGAASERGTGPAVPPQSPLDLRDARWRHSLLPREGSRAAAAGRSRAVSPPDGVRCRRAVDRGASRAVVAGAPSPQ